MNIADKRKRKCPLDREDTLKGRVLTKRDAPLAGANVSLAESPYKILSRTQENGFFEVNAFCFDKEKVILIIKRGYVPQTFRITDSKSTFKIKMENAGNSFVIQRRFTLLKYLWFSYGHND